MNPVPPVTKYRMLLDGKTATSTNEYSGQNRNAGTALLQNKRHGATVIEVEDSIVVAAPVDRTFEYIVDPTNQREITPAITDVTIIERLPNGGHRASYTYDMVGIELSGEVEQTSVLPGERIVNDLTGDITAQLVWDFDPVGESDTGEDEDTHVRYTGRYELPGRVGERALAPLARQYNSRMLTTTLENLKTRLEASAGAEG